MKSDEVIVCVFSLQDTNHKDDISFHLEDYTIFPNAKPVRFKAFQLLHITKACIIKLCHSGEYSLPQITRYLSEIT